MAIIFKKLNSKEQLENPYIPTSCILIKCGICTKQEIDLLSCDLTSYYLCQFLTDLRCGKTSKNQKKVKENKKKSKV